MIRTAALTIFFLLTFILGAAGAKQSRYSISGRVIDKATGEPVEFVTVALYNVDNSLVGGTSSDLEGRFILEAGRGSYRLCASLIGYVDTTLELEVVDSSIDMVDITIEEDVQQLTAATVTSKIPLLQMKMDKMVVNVSQSAFASSSDGLELIRKSPGVVVDNDGNVTLNGKKVTVWIDGRPAYVEGKALENLLKSTSGSSIDKIELMDHPSSKYDAQGEGGIINIKTKKGSIQGLSGSAGINGGGMYYSSHKYAPVDVSANLNLAYRTAKTNTQVNLSGGQGTYANLLQIETLLKEDEDGRLMQKSDDFIGSTYRSYQFKLSNDWFINEKNTLGFIVTVPGATSLTLKDNPLNYTETTLNDEVISRNWSEIHTKMSNPQKGANLNYTHIFDQQKSSELTVNVDYYHNKYTSYNLTTMSENGQIEGGENDYREITSNSRVNIISARADYQCVFWGNTMFETGAKWTLSNTGNNTDHKENLGSLYEDTTEYTYKEHVGAAYLSFSRQFSDKLSAKAGLRAEYTYSYGDWMSSGELTRKDYLNLFPTAYLSYAASEKVRLNLSYARRVNRPKYSYLNPTREYVDAHTFIVGNPDLNPEYIDNVSLQTGFGRYLSVIAEYRHTSDMIVQTPIISVSGLSSKGLKWENFGANNQFSLVANVAALPVTKWMQLSAYVAEVYMGNNAAQTDFSKGRFFTQAYADLTFMMPKNWTVELDANYQSRLCWGYFELHPKFQSNIAVKKTFLDGKMTLSAKLSDIFRTSSDDLDIYDPATSDFNSTMLQKNFNQKLIVGLNWSFGKAQKTKSRNVGNLEETSRAVAGSALGK